MKTVLLVDDEKPFLLSLRDGLATLADQLTVVLAHNGREALEILKGRGIDLVVTDLKMPIMDGFALMAEMMMTYPTTPVVVMTAYSTPSILQQMERLGTFKCMEKPLDIKTLRGRVLEELDAGERGYIRGVTLTSFLQLIEMEGKTCTLLLRKAGRRGYLCFRAGRLVGASAGRFHGVKAAEVISQWEHVEISIDPLCRKEEKDLSVSIAGIILDQVRLQDEASVGAGPPRRAPPDDEEETDDIDTVLDELNVFMELNDEDTKPKLHRPTSKTNISTLSPEQDERRNMSVQEKLREFAGIEGFMGAGVFTPAGEPLAIHAAGVNNLPAVGALANNVLLNAQKATLEMGAGRGQLVHIEGEKAHILVRCLNEGTNPLKSEPGKTHIHLVLMLSDGMSIGMAKMRINSIIEKLADEFRP